MGALEKIQLAVSEHSKRDFYYRPESVGDKGVIQQIFQNQDYELSHFRLTERLMKLGETESRRGRELLIIDAGANIGAAALYFSFRFSGSKVIAIEPEKKNCELLRMNCAGLNITIVEAALGCEAGESFLSDPGLSDWGFRTGDTGEYEVDVVTVDQLFDTLDREKVAPLICKIDIEGGEANLFKSNYSWLGRFPLVIIELHDWLLPGEGNSRNFLKAALEFDFDFVYRGENLFCFNNTLLRKYA
jgi:FkbM family methyltransferase